jgi:hypothetical protein
LKSTKSQQIILAALLFAAVQLAPGQARADSSEITGFADIARLAPVQADAIRRGVALGLFEGAAAGEFRPLDKLTRQELAALLARTLQLPEGDLAASYVDVPAESWSSPYIQAVRAAGIMEGDEGQRFRPTDLVTRQELAATLIRAAGLTEHSTVDEKLTADWLTIQEWARPYVRTALNLGIMHSFDYHFAPDGHVARGESAGMLMESFFPNGRASKLQFDAGEVKINGVRYAVSKRLENLFQSDNQAILQGARIKFEASERTIEKITYLELTTSGAKALPGQPEFSGNLTLDGKGTVIDGSLYVGADYISVSRLEISQDLRIGRELENDFYGKDVVVKGDTWVEGGDDNTVVFENSNLSSVEVNKQDVHVVGQGTTSVQNINVTTNATIQIAKTAQIQQVTVQNGASQVELQGTVQQLVVNSTQPTTISGNTTINQVTVAGSGTTSLNTTGTVSQLTVTDPNAKVTIAPTSTVSTVSLATGVSASNISASTPIAGLTSDPPLNTPPKLVKPLPIFMLTYKSGTSVTFDQAPYFTDAEQTALKYTVVSNNLTMVRAQISPTNFGKLILTPAPATSNSTIPGVGKVTLTVDDQFNQKTSEAIEVTVHDLIPTQTAILGSDLVLRLNQVKGTKDPTQAAFRNTIKDPLTYEVSVEDPTIATSTLTDGDKVTITPLQAKNTKVTIIATNSSGNSARQTFDLTVIDPLIRAVPNQILQLDGGVQTIDLTSYIKRPSVEAKIVGPVDSKIAAALNDKQLSLTPVSITATNQPVLLTIQAKDTVYGDEGSVVIQVVVNKSPIISPIGKQTISRNVDMTLSLASYLSDANGDQLTITAVTSDKPAIATATVKDRGLIIKGASEGTAKLEFTVDDGFGGTAKGIVEVEITNDKPEIGTLDKVTIPFGSVKELDLSSFITDKNGDSVTVTASTYNASRAEVSVSGKVLSITPKGIGDVELKITADDGHSGVTETSLFVTISNEAPKIGTIVPELLQLGKPDYLLDVAPHISDANNDSMTIEAEVIKTDPANTTIATVHVIGKVVTIHPVAGGTFTLELRATDVHGETTKAEIEVGVNAAPTINTIGLQSLAYNNGKSVNLNLGAYIHDVNGDPFTVTASVYDSSIAQLQRNGLVLTLEPQQKGITKVTITADDGRQGVSTAEFQVEVVNHAPQISALPKLTIPFGYEEKLDLSPYLSDENKDTYTVTAESKDISKASVALVGNQLTVTPTGIGTANIIIKADDGLENGSSERTLEAEITNEAPKIQPIADQLIQLGQPSVDVDLTPYMSDANHDEMTVTATSANVGIAAVQVTGKVLTLSPVGIGKVKINIIVTDIRGEATTGELEVDVNAAPTIDAISTQIIPFGGSARVLDVTSYIHDANNDPTTVTANVYDTSIATIQLAGKQLTIEPQQKGTTHITLTAEDGRGGVTTKDISVEIVNITPTVDNIPKQVVQLNGSPVVLDVTSYLHDVNNDPLSVSLGTFDASKVQASINDKEITLSPVAFGDSTVELVVSDGQGGTVTKAFEVRVNAAPTIDTVSSQVIPMNHSKVIELSPLLKDDNQDSLTVTAKTADESIATVTVNGTTLTIESKGIGQTQVTFQVTDGYGGTANASFETDIQNMPPTIDNITQKVLQIPGDVLEVDLTHSLHDVNNDELTVEPVSKDTGIATVAVQGKKLIITQVSPGQTLIDLTVKDIHGASGVGSVPVLVNQAPVIDLLQNQEVPLGNVFPALDLADKFHDINGDPMTMKAVSSDSSIVVASEAGLQLQLDPKGLGQAIITVTVSDNHGGSTQRTLQVTTTNQPPVIKPLPSDHVEILQTKKIQLANYLSDPNHDQVTVTADTYDRSIATVSVTGTELTFTTVSIGSTQVTVNAKDVPHGASSNTQNFIFTVDNDIPTVDAISKQTLTEGEAAKQIVLTPYLHDFDVAGISITSTSSSNNAVVTASHAGQTLTLTPIAVGTGKITVVVTDSNGATATTEVNIEVKPANNAPTVIGPAAPLQIVTAGFTTGNEIDLSPLFSDPDGDSLTYSAVVETASVAAATVAGNKLILQPGASKGITKVTVTANDGKGGTVSRDLQVQNAPAPANGIVTIRTKQGVASLSYDVSGLLTGSSFTLYTGTPTYTNGNSSTVNGTSISLPVSSGNYWVVDSTGSAVVLKVVVEPQAYNDAYFSEWLDASGDRAALEIYLPYQGSAELRTGYSVMAHIYNTQTNKTTIVEVDPNQFVIQVWAGTSVQVINSTFYDFFDLTSAPHYSGELLLKSANSYPVAIQLKRNGQIIDTIGTIGSTQRIVPGGGTIVRKAGIISGSSTFSLAGEWDKYPSDSFQFIGRHTP